MFTPHPHPLFTLLSPPPPHPHTHRLQPILWGGRPLPLAQGAVHHRPLPAVQPGGGADLADRLRAHLRHHGGIRWVGSACLPPCCPPPPPQTPRASCGWVLQPPNLSQTIPPRPAATRLLAGVCLVCCVIPVAIHLRLFCAGWKARRAGYPTPAPAGALHPPPSHKQLPRGWHLGRSAPWSLGGEGATAWLLEEDNHDAAAAIPLLGEEAGEDQGAGAGTGTGTGPGAGGGDSPYLGGPERGAGERQGEGAEGGEGLERGGSDAVPLSGVAKMYDRGQDLSLSTWLPSHMGGAGAGAGGGWLAARAGGRGGAGGGGAGSGGCTG